ncbi:MAG: choice-of-anchor D domain-containing protein [Gemmatimonadota bacterium]
MSLVGTIWAPIGPSPIAQGGRQDNGLTTAIAIHPNDGSILYQGTAGGGIWRSRDGGSTWTPLFDRQIALGIGEPGAIAIDPNDTSILYIGTSARVTPQAQAGLYKSTDGGASCVRLGSGYPSGNVGNANQFFNQFINVIRVDPANSQVVYLASSSGVFRSTDGGLNWTLGTGSSGDARSLVLDTTSPVAARILYAGVTGGGVIRSTDGGRNWTRILGATTPAVVTAVGATPGASFSKVIVDLAPPTSPPNAAGVQVLYAALSGRGGAPDPVGLFVSTDQGTTWTQQTATGMPGNTQGGYSFHMAVDPASPGDGVNDTVYVGCVGQARSTDAGQNFTTLNGMHADTHAWAFFPQPSPTPTTIYCGNDGGVFRSTDGGTTWTPLNSGSLQTALFYNLDIKPDAGASVSLGALQDNGIQTTTGATSPGWNSPQGGDGWDAVFDGVTAGRAYGTSGFWSPAPCTRVFRSDDDGASWPFANEITPWGTTSDQGCYLASLAADPSAAGRIYVSGNQNLWQTQDAGANWRNLGAFPGRPAVAPTNGNNVVVASGSQVFLSTNALAPTVGAPSGVTFNNITRNLPARSVQRVAFDPSDPTVIYCVLGGFNGGAGQRGHVFRTTVSGTAWQDISPTLDVPFGGLALDGSDTPTTIYVGTDLGVLRSVDLGTTWTVLDDIHFPRAPVTDLVLSRQGGILRAATYGRGVFEFRRPKGPAIAVNLEGGLGFGTVCSGPEHRTLQIFNVGVENLIITSVQRLMGSTGFRVLPSPGTPLILAPGEEIDFTVEFVPTTPGLPEAATLRINTNDPGAPTVDLMATGVGGVPSLETIVPDRGDFGAVCMGAFVDRDLIVNNRGSCPLRITGIISSSPAFIAPRVSFFPLEVAPGGSIELPVRFQPQVLGGAAATLTLFSNDPSSPESVRLTGNAPPPRLAISMADAGSFGDVCVGSFRDEPLLLSNSGTCPLTVTGITSTSTEFIPPGVSAYPLRVAPGDAVCVQIRFQPVSFGPKSAVLTVTSDDPTGPRTIAVSGFAPSGTLALSGSGHFGPVDFGRRAERTISICNVGKCDLKVHRVAFLPDCWKPGCHDPDTCDDGCGCGGQHGSGHAHERSDQCCGTFKIVSNPFPAVIRPGSCLPVLIRFTPNCSGPQCCELRIETDDPEAPETIVYVTGSLHRTLRSALKCWAADEIQELWKAGKHR